MSEALAGLRVVELGAGPVTGISGMILADFGAEVIRILPPQDRPLDKLNAAPMWSRGKHDLTLDLDGQEAMARLIELLASADALICNWRLSSLEKAGLDPASIGEMYPHLIYCHVSGFGTRGPLADIPGYEHVVAAYSGRMMLFQGLADRPGPVFSALQVGVHIVSQAVVTGELAARLRQLATGAGCLVETSMLQGMLPFEMGGLIGHQFPDAYSQMLPYMHVADKPQPASLYYHPAQAGDGRWMQFGNLLPHLFDAFLIATDLIDILADEDYEPKQLLFKDAAKHEAFRERMLLRIQERSADDWMSDFVADGGIVAAQYQTTQEALTDPDIVENGHALPRAGGVQLGPLARLTETPATIAACSIEADDCVKRWLASPRPNRARDMNSSLPLGGIRILDLSTIIAAPIGVSMLADMGAEVIKVEQVGGDPFRGLLAGLGANRVNAGKRSISLDLKSEAGREIVLKLAAAVDVLVHNYRPGVPERLGIGYEALREINPGLIYVQNNGYGPDGPGAKRPSTHPIPGAAIGGVMYQMGERVPSEPQTPDELRRWTANLMRANELNPDPNTGAVMATAITLGLVARENTGKGQRILVDMLGANAYANADDFLDYPGKPCRPMPDEHLLGLNPTYRLYNCANESWVFLGLVSDKEINAFVSVVSGLGHSVLSSDLSGDAAETILQNIFACRSAGQWQRIMTEKGIACVQADGLTPAHFWLQDEQASSNNFIGEAQHPVLGRYQHHGPIVVFDGNAGELKAPPTAGEHNEEILFEAGYDKSAVSELKEAGVLYQG